jgi:hypothetical protein
LPYWKINPVYSVGQPISLHVFLPRFLSLSLQHCTSFAEEGLETALKATTALYDQTVESLMQLTAEDISRIFDGAKVCDLLLQPGTTILDLALQAACFTNESK